VPPMLRREIIECEEDVLILAQTLTCFVSGSGTTP
jgi:hypothetical protein